MTKKDHLSIPRSQFFRPEVDKELEHQRALVRQASPAPPPKVPLLRRILLSNMLCVPLFGLLGAVTAWIIFEPSFRGEDPSTAARVLFFPVTSTLIVTFVFLGEGFLRRQWSKAFRNAIVGGGLGALLSGVALVPAGLVYIGFVRLINLGAYAGLSIREFPVGLCVAWIVYRSAMWALFGAAAGTGMNLGIGTRLQLRNSVLGGAVGGALGGLFFDPVNRFFLPNASDVGCCRLIGLSAVGVCIGIFVALGEHLSRTGWFRVQTGPLAGKSFMLYKDSTKIGSSPNADIYLFKDPQIAPFQVLVNRVGSRYEIVDTGSGNQTKINQRTVEYHRLESGDQVSLGATILEFEERSKRSISSIIQKA